MQNTAANFTLHTQLANDTVSLGRFPLSHVSLMNNKEFPWVILVPQEANIEEITDLLPEKRNQLMEEMAIASAIMRQVYAPDRINVAALGNVVPQLHVHIIARYKTDKAWPNPVWGNISTAYDPSALEETVSILKKAFSDVTDFTAT